MSFSQVPTANEKEQSELLEILDCFFDPEKKAIQPKPRVYPDHRRRKQRFNKKDKVENKNDDGETVVKQENTEDNPVLAVPKTEPEGSVSAATATVQ